MNHTEMALRIWTGFSHARKCEFNHQSYARSCYEISKFHALTDADFDDIESVTDILKQWSSAYASKIITK